MFQHLVKQKRQPVRILSLLGLIFMLLAGTGWTQETNANYWFNKAFQETNIDKKIEFYKKAQELNPNDPDVHNNLGVLYKNKGMFAEAIKEYETAIAIPDYETPEYAYYNLGVLYKDRSMYKKAIEQLEKAIQINPQFVKPYNALGLAHKGLGHYDEAVQSFKKALEINPNFVQANYNLQNLWRLSVDDTATKRQAELLYDEGVKLLELNQLQNAREKFQESLKINPQHVGAQEKLNIIRDRLEFNTTLKQGERLFESGKLQAALSSFDKTASYAHTEEEHATVSALKQQTKARLELQAKNTEEARLFQEGLKSLADKNWLQAISKFTKILMVNPQHELAQEKNNLAKIEYYYESGLDYIKAQQWGEAEKSFNDILKIDPQNAKAHEQLNLIAEQHRREEIASLLSEAQKAMTLNDFKTAGQKYQAVLGLDANQTEAAEGMEKINQLTQKPSKPGFTNYLNHPLLIFGFVVFIFIAYLSFVKIVRPSKVVKYYLRYKEYDKARIIYEKILEKDENRRNVYSALANTYIQLKRFDRVATLIQLCGQNIQQAEAAEIPLWNLCLGEIYQLQGKLFDAQIKMESAYCDLPGNQEIQKKLIILYEDILKQHPKDEQITSKLNKLKKVFAAGEKKEDPPLQKKETKVLGDDSTLNLLKECFGNLR